MRIIFAGTPDFAVTALEALIREGHEIALVLTQPDRPSGRGMKLMPSPVKALALSHGLPVETPLTLSLKRDPEGAAAMHEKLRSLNADLLVVAAYGLILPQAVLDCAKGIGEKGDIRALNIHGSLLPRWRGAAPVARAIEAGDEETGITLMKMELGLDTGPIIVERRTPITKADTSDRLMQRLSDIGAQLLIEALRKPERLTCTEQPEEGVTYAEKLIKTEGLVDWAEDAEKIERKIRAFTPFPSVYFNHGGQSVKIWRAEVVEIDHDEQPGTVLSCETGLLVACARHALLATELQRPGKPRTPFTPVVQALCLKAGDRLHD